MCGHLKFGYEAPNRNVPNRMYLNWNMQSQTKACIAKSSCQICALVKHYTAQSGNSATTVWNNLFVPSSRVKKSKAGRERD